MDGHFVGPMDPELFLTTFLPKAPTPRPGHIAFTGGTSEDPFIEAFSPFCPGMGLRNTTTRGGRSTSGIYRKPDVSCFDEADIPPASASPASASPASASPATASPVPTTASPADALPAGASPVGTPPTAAPSPAASTPAPDDEGDQDENPLLNSFFRLLQMLFEFKPTGQDPYVDPKNLAHRKGRDLQHWTNEAVHARGQTVSYALAMFESIPRVFCFSVVVMGKTARFVRWDRAGAIASEKFDWTSSGLMEEFLWRFSHMSRAQRGFDTAVSPASPAETEMVRRVFNQAEKDDHDIPLPSKDETFSKFLVWDRGGDVHAVIAGRPQTRAWTLEGRSTFGYVGVDAETEKIVYLKDTWRIAVPGMSKEGDIYARLQKDPKVTHLPDFRYGGDIPITDMEPLPVPSPDTVPPEPPKPAPKPGEEPAKVPPTDFPSVQRTVTQDYAKCTWACETVELVEHVHHRIVLGKVGRKLNAFRSTKELCQVLFDVLLCHTAAYKLGVLQRDLSASNILIDEDGRGILIDWDLCLDMNAPQEPRWQWRTGTWQYISAELLMKPFSRKHLLRDDLESIVHVLFHHVLRYRPAGFDTADLALNLELIFDTHIVVNGQSRGGRQKALHIGGQGCFGVTDMVDSTLPRPLVALMNAIRRPFRMFYLERDIRDDYPPSVIQKALAALDTAEVFTAIFKAHLEVNGWPENDGAVDQLPPEALPTQNGLTATNNYEGKRKSAQEGGRISKARRQSEHSSVSQALRSVEESQQPTA